ncbi:MAG: GHKL domain-containing protein [Polyangiaceae bacterium]
MTTIAKRRLAGLSLAGFVADQLWAGPYVWYSAQVLGFGPAEVAFVWTLGFFANILAQLPSNALASTGRASKSMLIIGAVLQAVYCATYALIPSLDGIVYGAVVSPRVGRLLFAVIGEIACGFGRPLFSVALSARYSSDSRLVNWVRNDGVTLTTGLLRTVALLLAMNGAGDRVWYASALTFLAAACLGAVTPGRHADLAPASKRRSTIGGLINAILIASSRTVIRATSLVGRHSQLPKALGLATACRCLMWAHLSLWFFMAKDLYGLALTDSSTWLPDAGVLAGVWTCSVAIGLGALRSRSGAVPSSSGIAWLLFAFGAAVFAECAIPYWVPAGRAAADHGVAPTQLHALTGALFIAGVAEGGLRARVPRIMQAAALTDLTSLQAIETVATALAATVFLGNAAISFISDPTGCWCGLALAAMLVAIATFLAPIDPVALGPEGLALDTEGLGPAKSSRLRYRMLAVLTALWAAAMVGLPLIPDSGTVGAWLSSAPVIEADFVGLSRPPSMGTGGVEPGVFSEDWSLKNEGADPVRCRVTLKKERLELLNLEGSSASSTDLVIDGNEAVLAFLIPSKGTYRAVVPMGAMSRPRCMRGEMYCYLGAVAFKNNPPRFDGGYLLMIAVMVLLTVLGILAVIAQQYFSRVSRLLDKDKSKIFGAIAGPNIAVGDLREMLIGERPAGEIGRRIGSALAASASTHRVTAFFVGAFFGAPSQLPSAKLWTWFAMGTDLNELEREELPSDYEQRLRDAVEREVLKLVSSGEQPLASDLPVTRPIAAADIECSTYLFLRRAGEGESRTIVAFGGLATLTRENSYVDDAQREILQVIFTSARAATEQALARYQTDDVAHTDIRSLNDLLSRLREQAAQLATLQLAPDHRILAIQRELQTFVEDRQIANHLLLHRTLPDYARDKLKLATEIERFMRWRVPNKRLGERGEPAVVAGGARLAWSKVGDWPEGIEISREQWVHVQTALLNVVDNVIKYASVEENVAKAFVYVAMLSTDKQVIIRFRNRCSGTVSRTTGHRGYGLSSIAASMRQIHGDARGEAMDGYFVNELVFPRGR